MNRTNRAVTERRRTNSRSTSGMYIDGNAVRKLQEVPERRYSSSQNPRPGQQTRKRAAARKTENRARAVSRETIRNRGFVIFLAVISAAVLFVCVNYLQLRAEVTGRIKNVAVLETELSELRAENDAYESQVNSGTDLNRIKKIAIGRLGMNYPRDDQKKTYSMSNNSYVRQYQDVPDTK